MWATDTSQIGQLALGLGSGALIAAIALGIVLTYKGSGVVNFHNGAVAIYAAYVFHGLRGAFDNGNGKLYLPPLPNPLALVEGIWNSFVTDRSNWIRLPRWPTSVDIDFSNGHMPIVTAFIVTLIVAAMVGLAFHWLIFRPLRQAPPLAKVVASVGLLLSGALSPSVMGIGFVLVQAVAVLVFAALEWRGLRSSPPASASGHAVMS